MRHAILSMFLFASFTVAACVDDSAPSQTDPRAHLSPPTDPGCGNGFCETGETHASCGGDCCETSSSGACVAQCGNGFCEEGETPSACALDCGACGSGGGSNGSGGSGC